MKSFSFIIFAIVSLFFAELSYAQGIDGLPQIIQDQLKLNATIELSPEFPKPNSQVTASVVTYDTNLDAAFITWKLNGKTVLSGPGERRLTFTVGDMNKPTVLQVEVVSVSGSSITKTLNLQPSSVDLIWQSESFVPPFYKGKAMMSHQNKISFIAIPHINDSSGNLISPKNLIYKWLIGSSVVETASGYGKNVYSFTSPLISRSINMRVQVSSIDASAKGEGTAFVNPSEPSILFYKKSPLYGIEFQKTLTGVVTSTTKEVEVVGIPFYFGTTNPSSPELNYKWFINGSEIKDNSGGFTRVFRAKEGTTGTALISLSIEDVNKLLQTAYKNFSLTF